MDDDFYYNFNLVFTAEIQRGLKNRFVDWFNNICLSESPKQTVKNEIKHIKINRTHELFLIWPLGLKSKVCS